MSSVGAKSEFVVSEFDRRVDDSDDQVFGLLGGVATVTEKGASAPLPQTVVVIYDNEFRIQGSDGGFINTYGGRSDGLTRDCHFLQFRKKELARPMAGSRFDLTDGRGFLLSEPVDEDQFVWTYAVTVLTS
jgi:hypothetical protein